jgi:hypothetical protein
MALTERELQTKEYAIEATKKLVPKLLAQWGDIGSEVWECSQPGSSNYATTICVSRMGISMMGDARCLVFNVGSNYGIPFLAGKDVLYYIKSKLEYIFQEQEFDIEVLKHTVADRILSFLGDHIDLFIDAYGAETLSIPTWILPYIDKGDGELKYDELKSWMDNVLYPLLTKHDAIDMASDIDSCVDLMDNTEYMNNPYDAYRLLQDFDVFHIEGEDIHCMRTKDSLIFKLFFINELAKKIMEIKLNGTE